MTIPITNTGTANIKIISSANPSVVYTVMPGASENVPEGSWTIECECPPEVGGGPGEEGD